MKTSDLRFFTAGTPVRTVTAVCVVAAAAIGQSLPALAEPIRVNNVYQYLDNRGPSDTGLSTGLRVQIGAVSVVPNGFAGTTGTASNVDYLNGAAINLVFQSQILGQTEFSLGLPRSAAPTSPWTLLFSNGTDQTQVTTPDIVGASRLGFARNVSISGTGTPTLRWAPTPGNAVNGTRLNIYNLDQRVNGLASIIQSVDLPSPTALQFTMPTAWNLQAGTHYAVEISLVQTRDGSNNIANFNQLSRSRSFFDFQLLNQPIAGPVYLPTVTPGTATTPYVFTFNISGVSNTTTTFIDPLVAVGYDYKTGVGNPNFASVLLPQLGDGSYELYLRSGADWSFSRLLTAGQRVDFAAGGVSEFRILGIEADAAPDADDPTAFVTGLTFTASGDFTGTMTPLTVNIVPEPAAWALMLVGAGAVAGVRRRRQAVPSPA